MQSFTRFSAQNIKPTGWLKDVLEIQKNGLCGNLDKMWPDVKDSSFIGGKAEGWERVPYWLDGVLPLGYLLNDEDLIKRSEKYIFAIIKNQSKTGWICPHSEKDAANYDTWAIILISKVFAEYYLITENNQVLTALYKMLKNYYMLLSTGKVKIEKWAKYRTFEAFFALILLKKHYNEEWIYSLADILKNEGYDYLGNNADYIKPLYKWQFNTHGVNLAMMLKAEALYGEFYGNCNITATEKTYNIIMKHNGTPVGIFTADECLSGLNPTHGTELCTVVELMFSFETVYALTGKRKYMDLLEKAAFNALPAALMEDMWSHQYDQLSNQISCEKFPGKPIFGTNGADSHLFGLEPHFGCCTANFGQGFSKLALNIFLQRKNEIHSALCLPAKLTCDTCDIEIITDYPFKNKVTYKITAKKDFTFTARIPGTAKNVMLNGKSVKTVKEKLFAGDKKELILIFDTEIKLEKRPHGLYSLTRGPLVFSVPISYKTKMYEYTKDGVERKFPYCDYELIPTGKWNYAFNKDDFKVTENKITKSPFSETEPPVSITATLTEIDWQTEDGYENVPAVAPKKPIKYGKTAKITLIPYASAKLRMTEIPKIK